MGYVPIRKPKAWTDEQYRAYLVESYERNWLVRLRRRRKVRRGRGR